MVLLISLILVTLLVCFGKDWIRRHQGVSYLICTGVALIVIGICLSGLSQSLSGWALMAANVFLQGGLAGAMFVFVMFAGAVPTKSGFRKAVLPVRGPLSIMACILTFAHNIGYGRYYVMMFTRLSDMAPLTLAAACCSLVMDLILIPLFITSFLCVRRKMKPASWKRLQRLAYVFYALMYTHVLLLNTHNARNGVWTAILNITLYSCLYIGYATMRIGKAFADRRKEGAMPVVQMIGTLVLALVLSLIFMPGHVQDTHNGAAASVSAEELEALRAEELAGVYADGSYKGAALGYNGRLKVKVTIEDGRITALKVSSHVEDEPYITDASEGVFAQILETGSSYVDAVSSATTTSDALMEAVRDGLRMAAEKAAQ